MQNIPKDIHQHGDSVCVIPENLRVPSGAVL